MEEGRGLLGCPGWGEGLGGHRCTTVHPFPEVTVCLLRHRS